MYKRQVCERPGEGGRAIQKAAFILAQRDMDRTEGAERLRGGDLMYVEGPGPDRTRYVIDAEGTAYPVQNEELLLRTVVGEGRTPQRVSAGWLATLHKGDTIAFPKIPDTPSADAGIQGQLPDGANKVGMVLEAPSGTRMQKYVVLQGRVAPVSDFMAKLLLSSKDLTSLGQASRAMPVSAGSFTPGEPFGSEKTWPQQEPEPVNSASTDEGSRNTVCNVLRDVDVDNGGTTLSTWAGKDFPATLPTGSSSAYVTPGSGQFFRQFTGSSTRSGFFFLVTDTGLRYAMQSNGDSETDDAGIGSSGSATERREQREAALQEAQQAQNRLGFKDVTPAPIPAAWSAFLPTGPRLSTGAARQPQGS